MEKLLQYLDDLDDLYGMAGLIIERLRRALFALFSFLTLGVGALAGIWLATLHAPIALATSILLFVTLLYRSVTSPSGRWTHTA
jgi:hypothetical protein